MRSFIEQFEEYFKTLDTKNYIALYLLTFALLGGGGYYFLFEPLQSTFEANRHKIERLKKKIAKTSPLRMQKRMKKLQQEIVAIRDELERLRLEELRLEQELRQKHYAILNPKEFSRFLDIMLDRSVQKRIRLQEVIIEDINKQVVGELYEKKRVSLVFEGSFFPIIEFLRQTEAAPYLFNIVDLNLSRTEKGIGATATLLFYGAGK